VFQMGLRVDCGKAAHVMLDGQELVSVGYTMYECCYPALGATSTILPADAFDHITQSSITKCAAGGPNIVWLRAALGNVVALTVNTRRRMTQS